MEYWAFILFGLLFGQICGLALLSLFYVGLIGRGAMLAVCAVLFLLFLSPGLAVTSRRLQDTNHSGLWLMCPLVIYMLSIYTAISVVHSLPLRTWSSFYIVVATGLLLLALVLISSTVMMVWCCTRGTVGPNRYGPDPMAAVAAPAAPEPKRPRKEPPRPQPARRDAPVPAPVPIPIPAPAAVAAPAFPPPPAPAPVFFDVPRRTAEPGPGVTPSRHAAPAHAMDAEVAKLHEHLKQVSHLLRGMKIGVQPLNNTEYMLLLSNIPLGIINSQTSSFSPIEKLQ